MNMDQKLKEMIAIGASVTANCIPCIQFHFARAREVGVTDAEIKAAVQVGKMVRNGAARKWDEEIASLLGEVRATSVDRQAEGCGCS